MTQSELALVSDAIKIGFPILGTMFGAIVGGVSAFVVANQSNKSERHKILDLRRYELIIEASQGVVEFEHLIAIYTVALVNRLLNRATQDEFEEARLHVMRQNEPLRLARAKLKLLGLTEVEAYLEEYVEASREAVMKGTGLSMQRATELNDLLSRGPVKFYESLSKHSFPKE